MPVQGICNREETYSLHALALFKVSIPVPAEDHCFSRQLGRSQKHSRFLFCVHSVPNALHIFDGVNLTAVIRFDSQIVDARARNGNDYSICVACRDGSIFIIPSDFFDGISEYSIVTKYLAQWKQHTHIGVKFIFPFDEGIVATGILEETVWYRSHYLSTVLNCNSSASPTCITVVYATDPVPSRKFPDAIYLSRHTFDYIFGLKYSFLRTNADHKYFPVVLIGDEQGTIRWSSLETDVTDHSLKVLASLNQPVAGILPLLSEDISSEGLVFVGKHGNLKILSSPSCVQQLPPFLPSPVQLVCNTKNGLLHCFKGRAYFTPYISSKSSKYTHPLSISPNVVTLFFQDINPGKIIVVTNRGELLCFDLPKNTEFIGIQGTEGDAVSAEKQVKGLLHNIETFGKEADNSGKTLVELDQKINYIFSATEIVHALRSPNIQSSLKMTVTCAGTESTLGIFELPIDIIVQFRLPTLLSDMKNGYWTLVCEVIQTDPLYNEVAGNMKNFQEEDFSRSWTFSTAIPSFLNSDENFKNIYPVGLHCALPITVTISFCYNGASEEEQIERIVLCSNGICIPILSKRFDLLDWGDKRQILHPLPKSMTQVKAAARPAFSVFGGILGPLKDADETVMGGTGYIYVDTSDNEPNIPMLEAILADIENISWSEEKCNAVLKIQGHVVLLTSHFIPKFNPNSYKISILSSHPAIVPLVCESLLKRVQKVPFHCFFEKNTKGQILNNVEMLLNSMQADYKVDSAPYEERDLDAKSIYDSIFSAYNQTRNNG